jgi:uncharacterized protein YfdQ (DUF2303 family)
MTIDGSAIEEIANLATDAAEPEELEVGSIYAVRLGDRVELIDLTGDKYREQPQRKTGTTTVRDVASFLALYQKHGDVDTEIYATREARAVTAVLDADTTDGARWARHRLVLQLTHTEQYQAWASCTGKYMTQNGFAEFLEDHRAEVVSPPAADLLELAQSFEATTKVTFRSGTRLKSGQRQLSYVEDQTAGGGPGGDLTIPDSFQLALPIFEGAIIADALTARLRYRIENGQLRLCFILDQLTQAVDSAFEGVLTEIGEGLAELRKSGAIPLDPAILRGTPPASR